MKFLAPQTIIFPFCWFISRAFIELAWIWGDEKPRSSQVLECYIFCVVFLWYNFCVVFSCCIFMLYLPCVEFCVIFFVLYFLCCIFLCCIFMLYFVLMFFVLFSLCCNLHCIYLTFSLPLFSNILIFRFACFISMLYKRVLWCLCCIIACCTGCISILYKRVACMLYFLCCIF